MAESSSVFSGLLAPFRALADSVLAGFEQRLRLITLELHEEKLRLVATLLWLVALFGVGLLALGFASVVVIFLFEPPARLAALGGVALFHLTALVALALLFRRHLARQPAPFTATLDELGKDRACIRKTS